MCLLAFASGTPIAVPHARQEEAIRAERSNFELSSAFQKRHGQVHVSFEEVTISPTRSIKDDSRRFEDKT